MWRFRGPRCHYTVGDDNHPHAAANQVGCKLHESIVLPLRPAIFDGDILALVEAGLAQTSQEHAQALAGTTRSAAEISDHRQRGLLGARRERPRRRAAEPADEFTPLKAKPHLPLRASQW